MSDNNFERGMDVGIQDLFDKTSLVDRIRKSPNSEAAEFLKSVFRNDLTSAHVKGHDEGVQDAVLDVLQVLSALPHRAGRKSCVEAVRDYFKLDDQESVEDDK